MSYLSHRADGIQSSGEASSCVSGKGNGSSMGHWMAGGGRNFCGKGAGAGFCGFSDGSGVAVFVTLLRQPSYPLQSASILPLIVRVSTHFNNSYCRSITSQLRLLRFCRIPTRLLAGPIRRATKCKKEAARLNALGERSTPHRPEGHLTPPTSQGRVLHVKPLLIS